MMVRSHRRGRRAGTGAIGAAALAGAIILGSAATADAQPPAPPNCSPADWAGVRAGVAAALSTYLFTHPPVNDFFATLKGQPREQVQPQVQSYLDANPQVRAELQAIRQPADAFLARCDVAPNPANTPLLEPSPGE